MIRRFEGTEGRRLRVDTLLAQKLLEGNKALAEELADRLALREVPAGTALIQQGGTDNEVFLILAGSLDIVVNGRKLAERRAGTHVGEMAAIEPSQRRSADVIATEDSIVAVLPEADMAEIGGRFPEIYRQIARELAQRLLQRNAHVTATHEKIRVFIICSAEAREVGRAVQSAFGHDSFIPILWTDGVFRATRYPLEVLEDAIRDVDFAIAIAHADDKTVWKDEVWPSPRDNVIFELGLFMGKLGRERAILMEPRDASVKLPSDLKGVVTVPYRFEPGKDMEALMAPACNEIRKHIHRVGPNNN